MIGKTKIISAILIGLILLMCNVVSAHSLFNHETNGFDYETKNIPNILFRTESTIIIQDPGPLCLNNSPVILAATPLGGSWVGTGITDTNQGIFDPSIAGVGSFVITYKILNSMGQEESEDITITVNPVPAVNVNSAGPFCSNDPTTILSSSPTGGIWSGTGITNPVTGAFNPGIAGVGTHQVSYIYLMNGCIGEGTISIDVHEIQDATIYPAGPFCISDPEIILGCVTQGGIWSGPGITNDQTGMFNPAAAGIGTHTIRHQTGDLIWGCDDVDEIEIVVTSEHTFNFDPVGIVCAHDGIIDLNATPAGGFWSGNGIIDPVNGTFNPIIAGIGTHILRYSINSGACQGYAEFEVQVEEEPDATIIPAGPFCLTDQSVVMTSATPGGLWSGAGITDPVAGLFNPTVAGVGNHLITYDVSIGSCNSTAYTIISVNYAPDIVISEVGSICSNMKPFILQATPPGGRWSGIGITDTNLGIFNPTVAGVGEHVITYIHGTGNCAGNESTIIRIFETPDASIKPPQPLCHNNEFYQLETLDSTGVWSGNHVSDNGLFDIYSAGPGRHMVTYTISYDDCIDSDSVFVRINPGNVSANFLIHEPECYGYKASIRFTFVSGGTPPYRYSWNNDTINFSRHSFIEGLEPGTYNFTVTDLYGCIFETPLVTINDGGMDCIGIPNAFTPNGDGINDSWIIDNIDAYPDFQVQVFNKWGQVVYEGNASSEPWDGNYKGKGNELPAASYIYRIRLREDIDEYVGVVSIVK